MARMAGTGRSLADLASVMTALPQVMVNVSVRDKTGACESPAVVAAVEDAEERLAGQGRVLLRPSGTDRWCESWLRRPRWSWPSRWPAAWPTW